MDNITRAFHHARAHYDNAPVTHPLHMRWSRRHGQGTNDAMDITLRIGRSVDGRGLANYPPGDPWTWLLTMTVMQWRSPGSHN